MGKIDQGNGMSTSDNLAIYDKAAWHEKACEDFGLPSEQARVHIGCFVGWLSQAGMLEPEIREAFADAIQDFAAERIGAARLIEIMGGVLASDMVVAEAVPFVAGYYGSGKYLDDYEWLFSEARTAYHVIDDTRNRQDAMEMIAAEYARWRTTGGG